MVFAQLPMIGNWAVSEEPSSAGGQSSLSTALELQMMAIEPQSAATLTFGDLNAEVIHAANAVLFTKEGLPVPALMLNAVHAL